MLNLYIVITLSIIVNLFVLYKSLGISYFTRGLGEVDGKISMTDNEKLITNAKNYKIFSWLSSVHSMPLNRAQLREFWFLAISLVSKFLPRSNNIIIVLLTLLSNIFSAIFLYLLLNNIFNTDTALLISLFYITSLWPYQLSLYVGHILFSQVWFLLSLVILSFNQGFHFQFIPFFLAGIFLAICFSSSSSSRKFPPLILLFFTFVNHENLNYFNIEYLYFRLEYLLFFILSSFIVFFFLNKIIKKKIDKFKVERNYSNEVVKKIEKTRSKYLNKFFFIYIALTPFLFCFEVNSFLLNSLYFILGILLVSFYILAPNFTRNIARYFAWWDATDWGNHFRTWPPNLFGIDTSGHFISPISWLPKFFLRIIPAIFILFILAIFYLFFFIDLNLFIKFSVILISFIPLIIMEISKAGRLARAYFPTLVSFLFLIGFVHHNLDPNIYFDIFFYSILFIQVVHSLYFFFKDILPTRMCSSNLKKKLEERNISEFTTYNNSFNEVNVFPMIFENPNLFNINFSNSIVSSNTKYFIVPGISSKSVSFECDANVIKSGDFKSDETLNYLIKNKLIEKCSVIKLPTFGCSKFFVLESEVTSFRSLIIKDIHQKDLDLGYLYVLDCDLVRKYISLNN